MREQNEEEILKFILSKGKIQAIMQAKARIRKGHYALEYEAKKRLVLN